MLNKNKLAQLKKLDVERKVWEIASKIRDEGTQSNILPIITLAATAYWKKESKSQKELMDRVQAVVQDETTRTYLKGYIEANWDMIVELSETDSDTLAAIALFFETDGYSSRFIGGISTPDGISKLAIRLLDIQDDDTVLDVCSGVNSFLLETALTTNAEKLIGIDLNTDMYLIAQIRNAVSGISIENIQGNALAKDYASLKANKVFSNFPFGMRFQTLKKEILSNKQLFRYFSDAKNSLSGDWVFSTAAMLNQANPGKTVVIMANAAIWNQMDVEIRKIFVTSGLVEAVISLPGQLLPGTALAVTMMVFSHGNESVKMIDASDFYTKGRRKNTLEDSDIERILEAYNQPSEKSKDIAIEALEQQDYILNPQRYLDVADDKWDKYLQLGDICKSVNRGAVIRSAELNKIASKTPTDFQYLMLQDIKNGQISTELPYITELDEKMDKYCIRNGNLIISKISPFKIAMVHVDGNKKILANGNLYFLDIDADKINPEYLMLYLQSERGMVELNLYSKGSVMQTISMQELKKVRVPDIPFEEQNRIVSEYQDLTDELVIISKQEEIVKEKMAHLLQEVF